MSEINFNELFKSLTEGVKSLAEVSLKDYENEAKADGQEALESLKSDLERWTKEWETGAITRQDLEFLLKEDEGLTKMVALKQAGLAEIHIDEFRDNVVNLIVGTIMGVIKV